MSVANARFCCICHHPSGRRKYCARHLMLARKIRGERAACLEALRRTWTETANGHLCEYTRVLLNEADIKSPLYRSYDHEVPGKGPIRLTFSRLNLSKKDLSWDEMRRAVRLMEARFGGAPFDKSAMRFRYFLRVVRPEDVGLELGSADPIGGYLLVAGQRTEPCDICESPAPAKGKYCARCNRFILHHQLRRAYHIGRSWGRRHMPQQVAES
jgi:hypothetical protein